jgi:chitin biosynthesis protein CHS5
MSQSPTKVQFTVGKLDAGIAILLTEDHYQIEFPSILLPATVTTGSIIDLCVTQNPTQEAHVLKTFLDLQSTIRNAFASKSPSKPELTLRNATQTSAVLEWEPIDIATAELKSLTLWRDGTRLGNIPKPLTTTTTKLSGLGIDTDYTFQLILRTTAGTYSSDALKIRTHKLTNLSGITVCAGILPAEQQERLITAIDAIRAKPLQKRVRIDTTHFICSVPEGEEWQRAKDMNVPIVVVDWIEACQREGKIVGVRGYYLDADPALRPRASAPPTVTSPTIQPRPSHSGQESLRSLEVVSESPRGQAVSEPLSTDVTGAVDQQNERAREDVASPVVLEKTAVPALEGTPETIKTSLSGEKGDIERKAEIHSNVDSPTNEEREEKFDEVQL